MPKAKYTVPTRTYGQVIELQLLDELKKLHKPRKHFAYQINVTWTDSGVRRVYRSHDQILDLHTSLSTIIKDGGMIKLTGRKTFERSTTQNFAAKHFPEIRSFAESLLNLPSFMQQSDIFLSFWEPTGEDVRIFDIDRTVNDNTRYPLASTNLLRGCAAIPDEEEAQDYICVCTAIKYFAGNLRQEHGGLRGLAIKEGDVIYVLRMSGCPAGFWMVRNVFGSEGHVPITHLRVDQDILQRKKRRSLRVQQNRLDMIKSAENISDRPVRSRKSCSASVMDLRRMQPIQPFSPPLSRTLRELNNNMSSFVEPRRSGRPMGYNLSSSLLSRIPSHDDRQVTHDLIRSLHETSVMLQERMVLSEMEVQNKRKFERQLRTRPSTGFVRSPAKRGPRVSARFKRMSASPSKFISPCRKGIKGLRIAAPSPIGASPSQSIPFEKSPGASLKRAAPNDTSFSKRSRPVDRDSGHGSTKDENEVEKQPKVRRRSEIARRVSLRLKQVYGKSPKRKQKNEIVV